MVHYEDPYFIPDCDALILFAAALHKSSPLPVTVLGQIQCMLTDIHIIALMHHCAACTYEGKVTHPGVLFPISPFHQEVSCAVLILPVVEDDCWLHLLKQIACRDVKSA